MVDYSSSSRKSGGYYQWLIIVSASIYCIMWSGLGYYVFSVFVTSLQTEFNWHRSAIMVGFLLWSLTNGTASVAAGRAVDRFHAKRVMMVGSIITAIGFISLGYIQSLFHFYLCYIIVGTGIAAMGQVPCSALVTEWFDKKRGLAIGLMSIGVGLGGLIMSFVSSGLLIPHVGWRHAYVGLGIIVFVVTFPLALIVIRPKHAQKRNESSDSKVKSENNQTVSSNKEKNRYIFSPLIWLIAFGFLFSQFGLSGTLQNQVPHMTDVGFSPITAASVLGMIGLISSFAKFVFGWLCDIIQVRFAFLITLLLQATGTSILLVITPDSSMAVIWVYAFAIGAGGGSWLPIMSLYISRSFPMKHYGTLIGIVNFFFCIGVATGPLFAGYLFDIKGSYQLAFTIFLACYGIAAVMGILSKPRNFSEIQNPIKMKS